jgi:invasion protein IalB
VFFSLTIAMHHVSERARKTGKITKEEPSMSIMRLSLKALPAAVAILGFTLPAVSVAQEADAAREPGEPYVAEVFRDWELRCITAAEPGQAERCEMFQLLLDENDNPVAVFRVNVPLVENEGQIAAAVIVTPLETLLAPGMRIRIDESEPAGLPYTLCEPTGCLARIPLTQENVDAFQAGADVFLEIFALVRSDLGEIGGVPVALTASLRGFTAAFEALQERHEAFAAFVAERQAEAAAAGTE